MLINDHYVTHISDTDFLHQFFSASWFALHFLMTFPQGHTAILNYMYFILYCIIVGSQREHNSTITLADTVDKDRMNLQILLSALLDADSEANQQQRQHRQQQEKRKNVIIVSPDRERGSSSAERKQSQKSKSNYTFSNDRARMIDLENQRLLKVSCMRTTLIWSSRS